MFPTNPADGQRHLEYYYDSTLESWNKIPDIKFNIQGPSRLWDSGQTIVFSGVKFNKGNGYNSTNGHFVAPITGDYLFNWAVYRSTNADSAILFYVGGVSIYEGRATTSGASGYTTIDGSVVTRMNAGDIARIEARHGQIHTNGSWSYFSGSLIG